MSTELQGIARFKFHPGKLEEFKRLSAEAMEIVRSREPGTLLYETYFNEDESEAVVVERFRDSQALIEHGLPAPEVESDYSDEVAEVFAIQRTKLKSS